MQCLVDLLRSVIHITVSFIFYNCFVTLNNAASSERLKPTIVMKCDVKKRIVKYKGVCFHALTVRESCQNFLNNLLMEQKLLILKLLQETIMMSSANTLSLRCQLELFQTC